MTTREQFIDALRRLPPAQRLTVLAMARTIRAARDAGDTRPAEVIVAHLVQPGRKVVLQ